MSVFVPDMCYSFSNNTTIDFDLSKSRFIYSTEKIRIESPVTIECCFTKYADSKLNNDKDFVSDKADDKLFDEEGVEMIVPHRKRRKNP